MMGSDLGFMPATELATLYRRREASPVEVVARLLDRIAVLNPGINAFSHLAIVQVREDAHEAEKQLLRGEDLPPLFGIPTTIKDHLAVRAMSNSSGSPLLATIIEEQDDPVVARLRDAGALILGKTTMSEFGWKAVSQSTLNGITHNPWGHGLNAGASSAGAAAAAAAGFGPLHLGSDGAGSIRLPAHFCGIFGVKPSYGRVPLAPVMGGDHIVHVGPLTRTVADAALMLKMMAGPHFSDAMSLEAPPADYPRLLGRRPIAPRLAYSADLGHARVDPEIAEIVRSAAEAFAAAIGRNLESVTPVWGPLGPEIQRFLWPAHQVHHVQRVAAHRDTIDPGLVACVDASGAFSLGQYDAMRQRKQAYIKAIHATFNDWNFLLTPTASVAAFPADRLQPADWPSHPWDWLSWAEFSYPFNLSGNPSASLPCGFTRAGLPVGLQITGRRFDDLGVLQLSTAFEEAFPWAQHRPVGTMSAAPVPTATSGRS